MVQPDDVASSGSTPHAKRERSDNEEEEQQTRHVKQRRENDNGHRVPMFQIIKRDLHTKDKEQLEIGFADAESYCRKKFFELGGHWDVVSMMNTHSDVIDVQHRLLDTLRYAVCCNVRLQGAFGKVGGTSAVLTAMKTFAFDRDIMKKGLDVLVFCVMLKQMQCSCLRA